MGRPNNIGTHMAFNIRDITPLGPAGMNLLSVTDRAHYYCQLAKLRKKPLIIVVLSSRGSPVTFSLPSLEAFRIPHSNKSKLLQIVHPTNVVTPHSLKIK